MTLFNRLEASGVYDWGSGDIIIIQMIYYLLMVVQSFSMLFYYEHSNLPTRFHLAETALSLFTGVHFFLSLFGIVYHRYIIHPRTLRSVDYEFKRDVEMHKITLYALCLFFPWCAFAVLTSMDWSFWVAAACCLPVDVVLYFFQPAIMGIQDETMGVPYMFVLSFFSGELRRPFLPEKFTEEDTRKLVGRPGELV